MPINITNFAINDKITSVSQSTPDTVYTATGVKAHVTACTAVNSSASTVTITLYALSSSQTPPADAISSLSIPAYTSIIVPEILGHVIPLGGTIRANSNTTNVVSLTISGFEIS